MKYVIDNKENIIEFKYVTEQPLIDENYPHWGLFPMRIEGGLDAIFWRKTSIIPNALFNIYAHINLYHILFSKTKKNMDITYRYYVCVFNTNDNILPLYIYRYTNKKLWFHNG